MIGKMYRPLKILNIPDKRGFHIWNKFKSNFGGTYTFDTKIYLYYHAEDETENVYLEFKGLNVPVYVEKGYRTHDGNVVHSLQKRNIYSLRKLVRPTRISSKESLNFLMMIESPKDETENDVLKLTLTPIVIDGEEFMKVEVSCQTPVVILSDSSVKLAE